MNFLSRVAALLICALAITAQAQNLSIATGGTGGVYYPLGGGMGAGLVQYVSGLEATAEGDGAAGLPKYVSAMKAPAEVTGGSAANPQLIGTGKPYLGMTMADATLDAFKG